MKRSLYERFKFFVEHAGYCTPPGRAVCAMSLARAELRAEEIGVTIGSASERDDSDTRIFIEWEYDPCGVDREIPDGNEVLGCAVFVDGECLASCGGIELASPSFVRGQARDPYIRVVQTELLREALYALDARVGTAEIMTCNV